MRTLTYNQTIESEDIIVKSVVVDTTFVLFFLAVEVGQSLSIMGFDTMILIISLLGLIVLPYYLQSEDKPNFGVWLLGRLFITIFAVLAGVTFRQTIGTVLPETFRFLPMTLLIITAMLSCFIQYYGFLKLRLAK